MIGNFNTEFWPVVYLKVDNTIEITDEIFDEYKKKYLSLLVSCKRLGDKIALIFDLNNYNNIENIPVKYIMKQVQFNKEIYKFNKEYLRGICILCKSKTFKNILNMYFAFSKPAAPFKLCRNNEKANIFLQDKCRLNFDVSIFNKNDTLAIDIEEEEEENDNSNVYEEDNENNNDLLNDIEIFAIAINN